MEAGIRGEAEAQNHAASRCQSLGPHPRLSDTKVQISVHTQVTREGYTLLCRCMQWAVRAHFLQRRCQTASRMGILASCQG